MFFDKFPAELARPPLDSTPLFRSTDIAETEDVFSRTLANSRIMSVGSPKDFSVQMNLAPLGPFELGYLEHGSDYQIDALTHPGNILFGFGSGRGHGIELNNRQIDMQDSLCVLSGECRVRNSRRAGCRELTLKVAENDLKLCLQQTLDRTLVSDLRLVDSVSAENPAYIQLASALQFVVRSLDANPGVLENPLLSRSFEDLLFSALLSLPSNYSEELLEGGSARVPSATVRRAEEFMEAHASEPIAIADVLAHVGCSQKTLFSSFQKHRAYSPNDFLQNVRLRLAHERLLAPGPADSVTSIAYDVGFAHMGRFSERYRRRYGVKPSETLRNNLT